MLTDQQLLAEVRTRVVRELEGFDCSSLVLRLNDGPDRSVLVIARLGGGAGAMVARVYEADLQRRDALWPTYLTDEDVGLLAEILVPVSAPSAAAARTIRQGRGTRDHDPQSP